MTTKQIDITLKWLTGEMSNAAVAKALHIKSTRNVYAKMAANIRDLYRTGLIKRIKRVPIGGSVD